MNFETIARPYAQAIYDHSQGWETDLDQLELALETPEVQQLIDSPKLAYKEKTEVFLSLFEGQIQDKTSNFIKVLGESKRISLIPQISKEYKKLVSGTKGSSQPAKIIGGHSFHRPSSVRAAGTSADKSWASS